MSSKPEENTSEPVEVSSPEIETGDEGEGEQPDSPVLGDARGGSDEEGAHTTVRPSESAEERNLSGEEESAPTVEEDESETPSEGALESLQPTAEGAEASAAPELEYGWADRWWVWVLAGLAFAALIGALHVLT